MVRLPLQVVMRRCAATRKLRLHWRAESAVQVSTGNHANCFRYRAQINVLQLERNVSQGPSALRALREVRVPDSKAAIAVPCARIESRPDKTRR